MGVSTDGQICYGIQLEEDAELPWDETHDGDIDEWWLEASGWVDIYKPWTAEGNYAPGWTEADPRFAAYYADRKAWVEAHPLPVEMVNCCSGDYPMWIAAVPGTSYSASRGYPEKFFPHELMIPGDALDALREFLERYDIETDGEPAWYLSSYWSQ